MSIKDMFNDNAGDMMPLEHAVRSGQREVVDILLRQRAHINRPATASDGSSAGISDPSGGAPAKKAIKVMKPIVLKAGRRR